MSGILISVRLHNLAHNYVPSRLSFNGFNQVECQIAAGHRYACQESRFYVSRSSVMGHKNIARFAGAILREGLNKRPPFAYT